MAWSHCVDRTGGRPGDIGLQKLSASQKKWGLVAAKAAIVVVLAWAVRQTIVDALDQLDRYPWELHAGWLAAAGGLYLLGLLPAGLFWHRVLCSLGQRARMLESLRAYFIGHLGKYVPGKAMVVVLRAGLIRGGRVNTAVAAVSVFFETLTMMAVGAFIAAAILAAWFRGQQTLFLAAVGLMVLAGLPTFPPLFKRLVRVAGVGKASPEAREAIDRLSLRTLLFGWMAMAAGWWIMGLSLWAVLRAMGTIEGGPADYWLLCTASVALSMVAGFLSLIPGGAVVRELVLAELLVPHIGEAGALVSAVVLRLVWLVSELAISGILYVYPRLARGEPPSNGEFDS
jgi:hypothetical protein